jgi:hypothetical protein
MRDLGGLGATPQERSIQSLPVARLRELYSF